jgi:hypothetical protein
MAATMVLAPASGATSPLKEYTSSFEMPCSVAGGLLHITDEVETRAKAPESVFEGETFAFSEASATLTDGSVNAPATLSKELTNFGATHAKGVVRTADAHATNAVPATENIAVTKLFSVGLPYEAPIELEKRFRFTAPTGTTYSFPEPASGEPGYRVTGHAGADVELKLERVNGGIEWTLEAFNANNTRVVTATAVCEPPEAVLAQIPIHTPIEKAEYKNWVLSGSLTDKKQGQAIALPEGSTFNGSGEVNTQTGAGSVTGNLSIPPFTAPLKLFGVLPLSLGVTIAQAGPLEGTVAKSEMVSGDQTLTIPANLNVFITSIGLFGLKLPTNCTTTEPVALQLTDTLTREELLRKGWSFTGATTLPRINCEGGPLGRGVLGFALSVLLSGPENSYSLKFSAPGV